MDRIRVSLGTAVMLGLKEGALPDPPTTAYIMIGERCVNNCLFCTQSRSASGRADMLSRVSWPWYDYDLFLERAVEARVRGFKRFCLQCLVDPDLSGIPRIIKEVTESSGLPLSVSTVPLSRSMMVRMKENGAERIGIAVDASNSRLFDKIKGKYTGNPYSFKGHMEALETALEIFGPGFVSTHLIVGLGESDRDLYRMFVRCREEGILPSLFSYTPMQGTKRIGDPPPLERYRALQVLRHLIIVKHIDPEVRFDHSGRMVILDIPDDLEGSAFMTSGCPDCNRPYYTERPGGDIYNYPGNLEPEDLKKALKEASSYVGQDRVENHKTGEGPSTRR